MSWWDSALRLIGVDAGTSESVSNSYDGPTIGSAEIRRGSWSGDMFGLPGPAGLPSVTRTSAMQVSAVWACVSLIAGAISTLPINITRKSGKGEREQDHEHPMLWMFNEEFCPRWSANAGWEWLALSRLFEGDAYAQILRGPGGVVTGLVPLHPLRVDPVVWQDGSRLAYVVFPEPGITDGQTRVIDQDDMLHVTGIGFDGRKSLSPLRHALRMSGAVALATQEFSAQFYANQQRPDYALVAPPEVQWNREQIEELRGQLEERHALARGMAARPMLLTGGLKMEALSLNNEDAQLLSARQFQVEEIARAFGVPPFMIGHNEKTSSWGTGVAEMGTGFVRYVLRPHLNAFRTEINRKIFRGPSQSVVFDTFELERADLKSLFESFRAALGRAGEKGFLTVNDVRRLINFPSRPEGDDLSVSGTPASGGTDAQPAV